MTASFCPECGSPLAVQYVEEEEHDRLVCTGCGHIHYINPIPVAGVIPVEAGKVWLLRRAIHPRRGYWTYPSGYVEAGETVEQAAARETREELGMDVEIGRLVGVYSHIGAPVVVIVYEGVPRSAPTGGKETLNYAHFPVERIPWSALAFQSTTEALRDWVNSLHPPE